MSNKKIDNVRPLKSLPNSTNTTPEEPTERSFLANLFRESDDPLQRQKDRDARFGRTSQKTNTISDTFTP